MLSYEKYHSKPIIDMPKIIHRCDGIMASGLRPDTHAIPALQPIVYDLFLLRGTARSEVSKELETQREVVVSFLLRLIQYHQALEMFVIILQQCHRESEDRWKRMSRMVTDVVLPALVQQQSKEEAILSRLEEMELHVTLTRSQPNTDMSASVMEVLRNLSAEETIAWFLLQVIGKCAEMLSRERVVVGASAVETHFLLQQTTHLMLYITHMFQSGLFRRVATAAMGLLQNESPACFYSIREINQTITGLSTSCPMLTLHWCNILILLNYDDRKFWSKIVQTPQSFRMPSLVKKTLRCLDAIHPSQSGALITLLVDKFLNSHQLAVTRMCDTIVCRRLEGLLAESVEESSKQLPQEDLEKLLHFMKSHGLIRHLG
nr:hypothetical protein BaRGS_018689 [Batillaria attramentaria]